MLILKTIDRAIEIIMKAVIVASMLVMAVLLFAEVVLRFAFNGRLVFSSEVCYECILLVTFGCAALVARSDGQIKISYLFDRAKWSVKRIWSMVINIAMVILAGYMAYIGFEYAMTAQAQGRVTQVMKIPTSIGYYIVGAGMLLLALEYLILFLLTVSQKDKIYVGREPLLKTDEITAEKGKEA